MAELVLPIRRKILYNQTVSIWDGDCKTTVPPIPANKKRQFMAQVFLSLVLDIIFQ